MDDDLCCKLISQHGLLGRTGHAIGRAIQDGQTNSSLRINIQIIPRCIRTTVTTRSFSSNDARVYTVSNRPASIHHNTVDIQAVDRVVLTLVSKVQFGLRAAEPDDSTVIMGSLHSCAGCHHHRYILSTDADSAGCDLFLHFGTRQCFLNRCGWFCSLP